MCTVSKREKSPENSDSDTSLPVASGAPSMSKAKSQTFDPFADLGNLGSNLPGKVPVCPTSSENCDLLLLIYSSCLCSFLWDHF